MSPLSFAVFFQEEEIRNIPFALQRRDAYEKSRKLAYPFRKALALLLCLSLVSLTLPPSTAFANAFTDYLIAEYYKEV